MQEVLEQVPSFVPVLFIIVILERLISLRENISPLGFFKALTLGITDKVHSNKKNNSVGQQKIAGVLALPILLFPFLFVIYMLTLIAEFPYVFEAILLWLSLSWSPLRKDALNTAKALKKGQKSLAKAKIDSWLLRDTSTLSPLGVSKATIESVILRSSKEYFGVIFYFCTLGPVFALFYRMITSLNQCWNPKLKHFRHFGQVTQWLCYLFDWLPSRFVSFSIMLLGRYKLTFQLMRHARRWKNDNSLMLLSATAAALKISLGGPAKYEGDKIRRPVIGHNSQTKEPDTEDIRQAVYLVEKVLAIWLLLVLLFSVLYFGAMK